MLLLAFTLCACKHSTPVSNTPVKQYKLDGVVRSLNSQAKTVTVDGQKVEGWMDAMTMDYPVKDPKELTELQVNEHINATVNVQDLNYWLSDIHQAR